MKTNDIEINGDELIRTKIVEKSKVVEVYREPEFGIHSRVLDAGCNGWTKDPEYNLMRLKCVERYCNDLLRARGYLFLYEVCDMLGVPTSEKMRDAGWFYDEQNPIGDNFVDFGLSSKICTDFINGYSNTVTLEFNVDSNIIVKRV